MNPEGVRSRRIQRSEPELGHGKRLWLIPGVAMP
jgi:hypothetical protein